MTIEVNEGILNQLFNELKNIKMELNFIKDRMPDKDIFLTTEEKQLLDESYKNEKEGKLVSIKALKKQMGI